MDRQFLGSVLAPFLKTGLIQQFCTRLGRLINFLLFLKGRANTSAPSLRNFAGIWSIPAILLASRLSKIFLKASSDRFENSKALDTLHEVLAQQFLVLWLVNLLDALNSFSWMPPVNSKKNLFKIFPFSSASN